MASMVVTGAQQPAASEAYKVVDVTIHASYPICLSPRPCHWKTSRSLGPSTNKGDGPGNDATFSVKTDVRWGRLVALSLTIIILD